ncbi:SMP-30/gluconolactonase/LRE family protein [uncultured Roseobacter sp.]|uniref:SMP-30/gluconolactonase/LRE family protein n=1 Tax=uncultured Roseobacter sp. TaxID=114847 RepID=UPI00261EF648|nr:SMP-30/gluconolactonase/LRE family protein [uncultured Roseobacter sp.]
MVADFTIECLLKCENHLGEGPIWDVETGLLYWVDSTGPRVGKDAVWQLDPQTGAVQSWPLSRDVGALALRKGGGAVLALTDGFYAFDFDTGKAELIVSVDDDPSRARLNDGKCDRLGRFFAGGMDDKEELGICGLWRLDPDLSLHRIEGGIICSNGPCWSPDDAIFYFADTFKNEIWAYDYDLATGLPSNKRVFASTHADAGFADGSTVDAEGYLWNAQVISGDLIRYAPDGSVERKISMPVRNITSVMFGGPDLEDIYVTSMARVSHPAAHDGFAKQTKPQFAAGSLFRIRGLGIRGVPEPRFAG